MPDKRIQERATMHVPTPIRGSRCIVKLNRLSGPDGNGGRTTYHFTFPRATGRGSRSAVDFLNAEHATFIVGDEAWAEVEQVRGHPWNYWIALRQVEAPLHA